MINTEPAIPYYGYLCSIRVVHVAEGARQNAALYGIFRSEGKEWIPRLKRDRLPDSNFLNNILSFL